LLQRDGLATVEPGRARFRSFLLGAVKHFLADMRDHEQRLKRGGGQTLEPVATETDTSPGLQIADPSAAPSDTFFDRQWALALMDRALRAVADEFKRVGKQDQFDALKPWLVGEAAALSQADVARQLGLNEGAVKVAIHRLRKRFREIMRAEIGQTVEGAAQVDEELRYLVEVLSTV
jgi:DNA-directed RNA polymerase specialized sigma24 family protein